MPTVGAIEQKIASLEGFEVRFLSETGANIRSDREITARFRSYDRRSADTLTVEDWKRIRFRPAFAGFDVHVLNGSGQQVNGNTLLSTVRSSYK